MSAVRRSHELVALGRGLDPAMATSLGTAASSLATFEGWAHALSLIPLSMWPLFAWRRRHLRAHGWSGPEVDPAACTRVLARLTADGPLTLSEFGGARGSGWERTSDTRWAAEWLEKTGDLVVRERRAWQRVYAVSERSLPSELLDQDYDDAHCVRDLARIALGALGVGTADVADYFRMPPAATAQALGDLGVPRVDVEDWPEPAWLDPRHTRLAPDVAVEPGTAVRHRSTHSSGTAPAPAAPFRAWLAAGGVQACGQTELRPLRDADPARHGLAGTTRRPPQRRRLGDRGGRVGRRPRRTGRSRRAAPGLDRHHRHRLDRYRGT